MIFINFYRMYLSIGLGIASYFIMLRSFWFSVLITISFRLIWFFIERQIKKAQILSLFKMHSPRFKELTGPYGVRLINRAENEYSIKVSLAEIFTPDVRQLQKVVEQLEFMDTLFKSGIRPDGDTYQLHDLKLKYGKSRLEKELTVN